MKINIGQEIDKIKEMEDFYKHMQEYTDKVRKYSDEEFLANKDSIIEKLSDSTHLAYEMQKNQKIFALTCISNAKLKQEIDLEKEDDK